MVRHESSFLDFLVRNKLVVFLVRFVEINWSSNGVDDYEENHKNGKACNNQNPDGVDEPEWEQVKETVAIERLVFVRESHCAEDSVYQHVSCKKNMRKRVTGAWN